MIAGGKLLLLLVFIAFTAPTASHAIAKMALMAGLVPQCQNGQSVIEESLLTKAGDEKNNESIKRADNGNNLANKGINGTSAKGDDE